MPKNVTAIITKDKCFPNKCSLECIKYDPINRSGGEGFRISEVHGKAEIEEKLVMEAHKISAKMCPFQAIKIVNLPQEKQQAIHQFGKNMFRLYTLPIPKESLIIGIIGRNGIGKSTSLSILSGNLKPNLGDYKEDIPAQEILDKYSTTLLGKYFQKLFNNNIKISYKPQRIELLPKAYSGKVKELLKKIDERNLLPRINKELNLEELQNRDLKDLSGGELQKIALAACLMKKAEVYYIDEPMSFLDITTRIKVARLIKELTQGSSCLVIEHDLTALDYISDEINIVYGEPSAYGVFSTSKSVRRGINEYLSGFIPDENLRFRDYEIKFASSPKVQEKSPKIAISYPDLEKKYTQFSLQTNSGNLHQGEVLGIVGANALGKSTFLKLIAGLEQPDKGEVKKIKLSYKPQYLESNINQTVLEFLKERAGISFNSGWYKQNILEKLGLQNILNNQISTLSGGELQKTHIAACLSEDVDLVAMDEPSAFIDVEDRLKIAEIIKEFVLKKEITAIIIDHDIQFIDYLADSMLVFEGIPGKKGLVNEPMEKQAGMNKLLKDLDITYRTDKESGRRRINKPGSQLDKEQRSKNQYYYV